MAPPAWVVFICAWMGPSTSPGTEPSRCASPAIENGIEGQCMPIESATPKAAPGAIPNATNGLRPSSPRQARGVADGGEGGGAGGVDAGAAGRGGAGAGGEADAAGGEDGAGVTGGAMSRNYMDR